MTIAVWDESLRTGHRLVDEQHQELFRMVNALHEAIVSNRGKEAIVPTLERLAAYTVRHFSDEEALMRQVDYPLYLPHKRKHEELVKKAKEMIEGYRTGKLVLSITLSNFLADWLRHHINGEDKALVRYVREQAARVPASAGA